MLPETQREQRKAYRMFLDARDGTPDVERRTLSRREEAMARYARPLAGRRHMDQALFDAQYASFDPKRMTSAEMLLLIALVKVNAAESYGVNQAYDKVFQRAVENEDDLELVLLIEETYHTRILLSSARLYHMDVTVPFRPPAGLRALIAGITHTPEFISRPLTLASEILGTLSFLNLLYAARDILKDDPELRDAVEERLTEVLIDEIGHISFNRMCLGPAGLRQARALVPLVAMGLAGAVPELRGLGLRVSATGADLVTSPGKLPEEVRRASFIA
jgi:hypothetical protein